MAIVKILVPVRGDGKGRPVLSYAVAIARRHNSHIVAVHCRTRPKDLIPYGVVVPPALRKQIEEQAVELANVEEASIKERYVTFLQKNGLELIEDGLPPRDRPSAGWFEEEGKQMDVIKMHGRLADLVAVAKPDRDRNLGMNSLKAALFNTGRPVLVCPPEKKPPEHMGQCIAFAWNGSTEASRALALTMPLFESAQEVVVLDGGQGGKGASGQELMTVLELHGVKARREMISAEDNPGRVILDAAKKCGADLLVMGAYGQSREHETVFGGATQYIVDRTDIPVVMVH
jgi:nucleotide-binding universal stress UspA family protein